MVPEVKLPARGQRGASSDAVRLGVGSEVEVASALGEAEIDPQGGQPSEPAGGAPG